MTMPAIYPQSYPQDDPYKRMLVSELLAESVWSMPLLKRFRWMPNSNLYTVLFVN
jgi:hypothetical protein